MRPHVVAEAIHTLMCQHRDIAMCLLVPMGNRDVKSVAAYGLAGLLASRCEGFC